MKEISENGFVNIIKGSLSAIMIALISVLIFAGIAKIAVLGDGVIKAVNQFIKIISVFLGCSFFIKGKMGLIKGCMLGLTFGIITYLLFSLFGANIKFEFKIIIDIIFCAIIGMISGIISVNMKR